MQRYVIKHILMLIPIIIGVSFLIFCMMELAPGDITDIIADGLDDTQIAELRHELNLDRNVFYRYIVYMGNLLRGDMGYSYLFKQDVWFLYMQRLPNTIRLSFASVFVCVVLSISVYHVSRE